MIPLNSSLDGARGIVYKGSVGFVYLGLVSEIGRETRGRDPRRGDLPESPVQL